MPTSSEKIEKVREERRTPTLDQDLIPRRPQKKSRKGLLIAVICIILIVVGGGFLVSRFVGFSVAANNYNWQAVFLTNGQVYFGHLVKENKLQLVLKDIYYLQVVGGGLQQNAGDNTSQQGELTLVKLGNELHGPKDEMRIMRTNVLFIEDLKEDSKVTEAIVKYLEDLEADKKEKEAQSEEEQKE